jgi:hypothetical protein
MCFTALTIETESFCQFDILSTTHLVKPFTDVKNRERNLPFHQPGMAQMIIFNIQVHLEADATD